MRFSSNQKQKTVSELLQLISFAIDKEEYAVSVLDVIEVIRLPKIKKLPKAPHFLKGIISLRGEVIPIVDLRQKFGLAEKASDGFKRTIIVSIEGKKVGLIVDSVSKVIRVQSSEIKEAPSFSSYVSNEYIKGIIMQKERMIILLDLGFVFSKEEISRIAEMSRDIKISED
jgi:purine-binding chemotaxis protein CheW